MGVKKQNPSSYRELEDRIGYRFRQTKLLERALTHPSYAQSVNAGVAHNQRLEFLGDAILGTVLAERLYAGLPDEREGALTRYRSILVNGAQLAQLARELDLPKWVRMGAVEDEGGARGRDSILEDVLEALVGAIYLDSDFVAVRDCVLNWYGDLEQRIGRAVGDHNPKGQLQEQLQPEYGNDSIDYRVVAEKGPDHGKVFEVEVRVNDEAWGRGSGSSKKEAEELAAREALGRWQALRDSTQA